jgi:hypothetical protein
MRHRTRAKIDWKGLGYLVSIVSVILLGAIAWPTAEEPLWHLPVLLGGVSTSIFGMGLRYKAHIDQQKELKRLEAEKESPPR